MTRKTTLWIAVAVCALAGAVGFALYWYERSTDDPLIAEFHATERKALDVFNDALRRQKANRIDERALAWVIDNEVLPPWRELRAHVEAHHDIPDSKRALFEAMRRYLADRQTAWEAYSAALSAPSDADARPHYDVYHQKAAEALEDVRVLGPMLR